MYRKGTDYARTHIIVLSQIHSISKNTPVPKEWTSKNIYELKIPRPDVGLSNIAVYIGHKHLQCPM